MDLNCDYTGNDFGATYPDSICIDGYLWDMDSGYAGDAGEWYYTIGGDCPCPKCNPVDLITGHHEENQIIIEEDYIECSTCGNINYDTGFEWDGCEHMNV